MHTFLSSFSGISVDNIDDAKEFYGNFLGLEPIENTMGLAFNLPGGGRLFIYEKPNHEPATFTVLNFVVKDIEAVMDDWAARGLQFERYEGLPAEQDERGILRGKAANMGPDIAWFLDPAGNVLALVEE